MSAAEATDYLLGGPRAAPRLKVLSPDENAHVADGYGDEDAAHMLRVIASRKSALTTTMTRLAMLCDRYDNLYYPNVVTKGGADHWPDDPNRTTAGRAHVSVNAYPIYVDLPASFQSVLPIENIVPSDPSVEGMRTMAQLVERLFFAWKQQTDFETKSHKACVAKGLYGRTCAKVYWDDDKGHPDFTVIDQPRNLWLGWSGTDYTRLDHAIYIYRIAATTAIEEFGIDLRTKESDDGSTYAFVQPFAMTAQGADPWSRTQRDWLVTPEWGMVEVNDYWYRCPDPDADIVVGEPTKMVTMNAITVGNCLVKHEPHKEYGGNLPFIPLFNTYIPGVPDGRSEFYDIEQLIREKDERISAGATLLHKVVGPQFWQLVGPEAPDRVPTEVRPKPNQVVAPGAGNRIETITPFIPEFQLEQYLTRIDREIADVSGLNDLLRGLAPARVLSSSKAINALVANYSQRLSMKRNLLYKWRIAIWEMSVTLWENEDSKMKQVFADANKLVLKDPALTPRDDLETATRAANLMNSRIWSQARAMDATGVEDIVAEQNLIREERTDAGMFPGDVQTIAAVMSTFQQMGITEAQLKGFGNPEDLGEQANQAQSAMAQQTQGLVGATDMGQGETPMTPPSGMPANAQPGMPAAPGGPGLPPGMAPPPGGQPAPPQPLGQGMPGASAEQQMMIQPGRPPRDRILMKQPIGPQPPPGP